MFRTLLKRVFQRSASALTANPFHMKSLKFASLFLASSVIYNFSHYQLTKNAIRVLPNEFLTTEDVDDGPADWTPDGKRIMTVCITGAAGFLSYAFLPHLVSGSVFGPNVQIRLRLLDIPNRKNELKGIALELADSIPFNLESVKYGSDPNKLFKHCDLIVFIGGKPRTEGMKRADLLKENAEIYKTQGKALNEVGKKDVRCVVVANPANTNCLILQDNAKNIPKQNFTCLTRLDQNRAIAQLARKANILPDEIDNVVVWGNHSSTIYPDVNNAKLQGKPIRQVIYDDDYLDNEFVAKVQKRGDVILETEKQHPSILSGARALRDHIRDWWQGTEPGHWVSMGVVSDGSYGVPEGMVFSFPVISKYFRYNIVKGLDLDDLSKKRLNIAIQELIKEWETVN